jgi:hypothetical protein
MDFINIICNVILSVIFAASFICIFFFTYAKNVEKQIVLDNLKYIVTTLLGTPISLLKSEGLYDTNILSQLKPGKDDYEADKTVIDNNNKLMKKSFLYIGILLVVGLSIVFGLSMYENRDKNEGVGLMYFRTLILKNLFMVSGIALVEFIFLTLIAAKFKAADDNAIIKEILINLNNMKNNNDHED